MKKKNKKNLSVPGVELFRDVCLLIHGDETKNRKLIERNKMKIWKRREGKLVFSPPSPLVLSDYRKKERTRKIKRIKERKTLCSAYFDLLFKIKRCIYTDRYILFSIFKIFFPSFFFGKIFLLALYVSAELVAMVLVKWLLIFLCDTCKRRNSCTDGIIETFYSMSEWNLF